MYLVVVWLLHAPLGEGYRRSVVPIALATAATLGAAALVPLGLPVPWLVVLVAVPPCVLVATHLDRTARPSRDARPSPSYDTRLRPGERLSRCALRRFRPPRRANDEKPQPKCADSSFALRGSP